MGDSFRIDDDDVLADVLGTLRLRSRIFCRSDLSAPWAMTLSASAYAHFHVVERGSAWLRLDGSREAVALEAGDLAIVPHGRGHTLADRPDAAPVPIEGIAREAAGDHYVFRYGGGGDEARMICGSFDVDRAAGDAIFSVLPEVVRVRSAARPGGWLDALLRLLSDEARAARQGSGTIVTRLTDIIFVHAVRAWLDELPEGAGGWLGALRDPKIGAAIARVHREPARDWTVAELASEVGMSRSPFAARFRALVGEPPLAYLTRWRMALAAGLLRDRRLTLREMAERTGYESEPAFSRAFKRHFGVSPRAFRDRLDAEAA